MNNLPNFYKGKKVLITGHTGFKGTWLAKTLVNAGADVCGYSRCSEKDPDFFAMSGVEKDIKHVKGDVRDYPHLQEVFTSFRPEIVFHLAAQPIVRESYEKPLETYETNVMGTANVLECIRKMSADKNMKEVHQDGHLKLTGNAEPYGCVRSAVIITTDKVYRNDETGRGFKEDDVLDGFDPYSNSKSCAELVTAAYKRSYPNLPPISTARAGNVIGGGDFQKDRIIPDSVRAVSKGEKIIVRNPHSIRPFQHVLEPLFAYLLIAEKQYGDPSFAGAYNIGPDDEDCITTGELVGLFCKAWGDGAEWVNVNEESAPHEAGFLKLDNSLMKQVFGWQPVWHIEDAVEHTVKFSRLFASDRNITDEMNTEIINYFKW